MPKAPINARYGYFYKLRDGSRIQHDWNTVDTDLGRMVEPCKYDVNPASDGITQIDVADVAYTDVLLLDNPNTFGVREGTDGQQLPVDFNTQ